MGGDKFGDVCANVEGSDEVLQEDGFDWFRDVGDGF